MQLDIFNQAQQLKEKGMQQSMDTANAVHPNWASIAYNFLLKYIKTNKEFMIEDVREAAENTVPQPPSNRAWGGIVKTAERSNLIKRKGYKTTKNPNAHGTPATLWVVMI